MKPLSRRGRVHLSALAAMAGVCLGLAGCGGSSGHLTAAVSAAPTVGVPAVSTGTFATTTTATGTATTATGPALTTPASATAGVRVGGPARVAPTPRSAGFLGISAEQDTILSLAGTAADPDIAFRQLLENLSVGAPPLLRLGGDSTDWSWWKVPGEATPAAIRLTLTPAWAADVKALLTAIGGKAILGVNLELDQARVAAYEAAQDERYIGSGLIDDFEIGNEPELYPSFNYYTLPDGTGVKGRQAGHYSLDDYSRDFSRIAAALGSDPIAGPSSGSPTWLPELSTMLSGMPARLGLVTVHAYPLKRCSASTHLSVSDFFTSASTSGLAAKVAAMVRAGSAHHKPVRLDEINGISCGGEAGVSNSFAEALWALNVLPDLWRAGVQGVNWQTINGNLNQMISARREDGAWQVSVQPVYYGLLAFAQITPAGSRLLDVSAPSTSGPAPFAVADPDGSEAVVLTNLGSHPRSIGVTLSGNRGPATVAALDAGSLTALSGTTLAGQSLSPRTGALSGPEQLSSVSPNARGVYAVTVPAHAAAILRVG